MRCNKEKQTDRRITGYDKLSIDLIQQSKKISQEWESEVLHRLKEGVPELFCLKVFSFLEKIKIKNQNKWINKKSGQSS